ncbi:hypothetical protein [Eoetvoesiella caeni]
MTLTAHKKAFKRLIAVPTPTYWHGAVSVVGVLLFCSGMVGLFVMRAYDGQGVEPNSPLEILAGIGMLVGILSCTLTWLFEQAVMEQVIALEVIDELVKSPDIGHGLKHAIGVEIRQARDVTYKKTAYLERKMRTRNRKK